MKGAQDARSDAPTQRPGIATHFDFGDSAFLKLNYSFTSTVTDHPSQKFAQVRVVSHEQQGVLARKLFQHLLELREGRLRTERVLGHQLALVPHFVSHQSRSLRGAVQPTGADNINLHAKD